MSYTYHLFKNEFKSYRIIEYDTFNHGEIYTLSWVLLNNEQYDVPTRNRILKWLKENHCELII